MKNIALSIVLITTIILPINKIFAQDNKEFKSSGKVWGYAFGDYYFKTHADSANRGVAQYSGMKKDANSFEFRRIYLGYDYNISEKFSTEFLLAYEGSAFSSDGSRSVYIKSANLRWKNIIPKNTLAVGQSQTPAFPMLTEKIWGYRSVEKTVLDMHKNGSSNDLGVSLLGTLDSAGNFGYNLMVGNGTAAKIESDRFKKFYGDVYAKLFDKKIVVDLYSDYERTQLNPYHKSKMTTKIAVAYTSEKFTIGIEMFQQIQENNTTYSDTLGNKDTVNASVFGLSYYLRGMIVKDKLAFYLRADVYDPDSKFNKNYIYSGGYSAFNTEIFLVAGVDYSPVKNVHIIPNIWYNGYANRQKNAAGLAKADYDLVPRLTFHYLFK